MLHHNNLILQMKFDFSINLCTRTTILILVIYWKFNFFNNICIYNLFIIFWIFFSKWIKLREIFHLNHLCFDSVRSGSFWVSECSHTVQQAVDERRNGTAWRGRRFGRGVANIGWTTIKEACCLSRRYLERGRWQYQRLADEGIVCPNKQRWQSPKSW